MPHMHAAWTDADLIALDLEGSGPQDPHGEAILEIAIVPLVCGQLDMRRAFTTLINPGRRIQHKRWISPGITNAALAGAPSLEQVTPEILQRLSGKTIVGHNVGVDWRLLYRWLPDAAPSGLVDTLRLARALYPERKKGHSLTAWVDRLGLTDAVNKAAHGSQPHRALWDTVAAALLLHALMQDAPPPEQELTGLLATAGVPLDTDRHDPADRSTKPLGLTMNSR